MLAIWGIALIALAGAALIGLGVLLTVAVLRRYRSRNNTKILIAGISQTLKNMPDADKHAMSFDEMEKYSDKDIVAEFDPLTDEVIKTNLCDKGVDTNIDRALQDKGGYIIVS